MSQAFSYLHKTSSPYSADIRHIIDGLKEGQELVKEDLVKVLGFSSSLDAEYLFEQANYVKTRFYGNRVFLRALIEISNYCNRDCYYCGISGLIDRDDRYRLDEETLLSTIDQAASYGYQTFVLQGGEDPYFNTDRLVNYIKTIKERYPNHRVTLSLSEKDYEDYQRLFDAGADRYLLRHETASKSLYEQIHGPNMSFAKRRECLLDLKKSGFQVGAGFMVGLPNQTASDLADDLLFLKGLDPAMVGIGPYIVHEDTKMKDAKSGGLVETLMMVALARLILPKALIPATTALGVLDALGRERALLCGANVLMPNVSPEENLMKYEIYKNKTYAKDQSMKDLSKRLEEQGLELDFSAGDVVGWRRQND